MALACRGAQRGLPSRVGMPWSHGSGSPVSQRRHKSSGAGRIATSAATVLYTGEETRGRNVEWYVKELSVPDKDIDLVFLNMEKGEHRQESYLKLNPFGKVPALQDGDVTLFESGAILLYLAEKFSKDADTPEKRAAMSKWIHFSNTTLMEPMMFPDLRHRLGPHVIGPLGEYLGDNEFLEGDFSVADVAVGGVLALQELVNPDFDYSKYPAVKMYRDRLINRPAYKETLWHVFQIKKERMSKGGGFVPDYMKKWK